MSCLDPIGTEPQTIIRGEDAELFIQLPSDEVTGDPIDLTGAAPVLVKLKAADTIVPVLSLALADSKVAFVKPTLGYLKAILSAADSALLQLSAAGGDRTVQVEYTKGGNKAVAVIVNQHTVADPAFAL